MAATAVRGDPTKATAEKGRILFEAAVTGLVELVDELRGWPIAERRDTHRQPVQADIRWPRPNLLRACAPFRPKNRCTPAPTRVGWVS